MHWHRSAKPKDAEIWLFEGEQKADLAQQLGVIASTCGGSGNVTATDLQPLTDKTVVIWADNDKAGIKCRDELAQALQQLGCKVQFVDLEPLKLPEKGDIVDWYNAQQANGLHPTLDDLQQLKRIPYTPPEPTKTLPNGLLAESMEWERGHFEVTEKGLFLWTWIKTAITTKNTFPVRF
jgi:DNA primase